MHVLACGHALCIHCLASAVESIYKCMMGETQFINSHLNASLDATRDANRRTTTQAAYFDFLDLAEREKFKAWDTAGFVCCGIISGIWEYLHCLEPVLAKHVWLSFYYILTSKQSRLTCGWPDCGMWVPSVCLWETEWEMRWHCVLCGGNSKDVGNYIFVPAK